MNVSWTQAGWLDVLLARVARNDVAGALGSTLACSDALRMTGSLARCGVAPAAVVTWYAHLETCGENHEPQVLAPAERGMLAADALVRQLLRPVATETLGSTLACQDIDAVALAAQHLNRRCFLGRDLLIAHGKHCQGRHAAVATLPDARAWIDQLDQAGAVAR